MVFAGEARAEKGFHPKSVRFACNCFRVGLPHISCIGLQAYGAVPNGRSLAYKGFFIGPLIHGIFLDKPLGRVLR